MGKSWSIWYTVYDIQFIVYCKRYTVYHKHTVRVKELCKNPQFLIKIIFGVTLILYWYRIVLILTKNNVFITLFHKNPVQNVPKIKNDNFWIKKLRENAVQNWLAKDWRIFQVLSTIKVRQSLAKDCISFCDMKSRSLVIDALWSSIGPLCYDNPDKARLLCNDEL